MGRSLSGCIKVKLETSVHTEVAWRISIHTAREQATILDPSRALPPHQLVTGSCTFHSWGLSCCPFFFSSLASDLDHCDHLPLT